MYLYSYIWQIDLLWLQQLLGNDVVDAINAVNDAEQVFTDDYTCINSALLCTYNICIIMRIFS